MKIRADLLQINDSSFDKYLKAQRNLTYKNKDDIINHMSCTTNQYRITYQPNVKPS